MTRNLLVFILTLFQDSYVRLGTLSGGLIGFWSTEILHREVGTNVFVYGFIGWGIGAYLANYKADNKSKHNLKIGYGYDVTLISGWSIVGNFERLQSSGKDYSNDIYLSVGYVPIDEIKFVFDVNNFENTSLSLTNKVNGFDLKMSSNYNFLSEIPDYGANINISNKF